MCVARGRSARVGPGAQLVSPCKVLTCYFEGCLIKLPAIQRFPFLMGKIVCFPIKTAGVIVMQSINNKAISRIYGRGRGWAFSPNDFVEGFSRDQIENALSRLCREGKIRRVCRGIYDYPKYSELLQQELSPDFDQVAQAFARKFSWRIQPSGDTALNLLGLSTQVPGRLECPAPRLVWSSNLISSFF